MQTDELIIVKARITMKTTEEGGRKSGFISGYRPNHIFEPTYDLKNLQSYIGDIRLEGEELFEPGESKIVTVRFLNVPPIEKYIKVGQKWLINEGPNTLGYGEILEIF